MESAKIFTALKSSLQQFEADLSVIHDKSDHYYVNTLPTETNKKSEFFGAVQIKKNYVAFHLMPIYYYPELLADISSQLNKRLQGKSCFNFKNFDDELVEEIHTLTTKAFHMYRSLNKI